MRRFFVLAIALAFACSALPASARTPVPIGTFPSGAVDGITDVAGVKVGHVTKVEGTNVRTGATGIIANDDTWSQRVAAATFALNGNGEMTGAHWVDQSGFLEVPVVLTDTLDVGRADDGVVSWLIAKHPQIGVREDVPLPVVAECDDQGINDIQGRHVRAEDVTLETDAAGHASTRNHLAARVVSIAAEGPIERVTLDCGFALDALITRRSREEMHLTPGDQVTAAIKATSIHLVPRV